MHAGREQRHTGGNETTEQGTLEVHLWVDVMMCLWLLIPSLTDRLVSRCVVVLLFPGSLRDGREDR